MIGWSQPYGWLQVWWARRKVALDRQLLLPALTHNAELMYPGDLAAQKAAVATAWAMHCERSGYDKLGVS